MSEKFMVLCQHGKLFLLPRKSALALSVVAWPQKVGVLLLHSGSLFALR